MLVLLLVLALAPSKNNEFEDEDEDELYPRLSITPNRAVAHRTERRSPTRPARVPCGPCTP